MDLTDHFKLGIATMQKLGQRIGTCCRIVIVVVGLLVLAASAEACPGCRDAIAANDPEQARMVKGYFWSILFMMSMPFAILGTFSTYIYLEVRRARSDRQRIEDDQHQGSR